MVYFHVSEELKDVILAFSLMSFGLTIRHLTEDWKKVCELVEISFLAPVKRNQLRYEKKRKKVKV